jgi:hypothetical protein
MRVAAILVLLLGAMSIGSRADAFSVLAHQAVVDRTWNDTLEPVLRRRFPSATGEELEHARPFAYGGSHIADLGYFPFGSHLFTDLLHYVRSGDLVATMLARAQTVDEYAFALGALSHYVTDNTGHPEATNRVVPEIYPELRERYGDVVTYADDTAAHLQTEFRFDVLQVAHLKRPPDLFEHAIRFEVSKPLLERAFRETYGLGLDDVFTNTDVAITSYRWAFREAAHEATGVAWELYRGDIRKLDPEATPAGFVFDMSREDFEEQFGDAYERPGYFARSVAFLGNLVPNVGPLKRLPYKPLPEDAQQRFELALDRAVARYRNAVRDARRPRLPNETLDTGKPTRPGAYEPADRAYAQLLGELRERGFADVSPELRADILRFYSDGRALAKIDDDDERAKVDEGLARLDAALPRASRLSAASPSTYVQR